MSITAGTNKWASRIVVVLQLAAWSAVGIVLLEKGVASLQKSPNDLSANNNNNDDNNNDNPSQQKNQGKKFAAIPTSSPEDDAVHFVIPFNGQAMVDDEKKSDNGATVVRSNKSSTKEETKMSMAADLNYERSSSVSEASISGNEIAKDPESAKSGKKIIADIVKNDKTRNLSDSEWEKKKDSENNNNKVGEKNSSDEAVERNKKLIVKEPKWAKSGKKIIANKTSNLSESELEKKKDSENNNNKVGEKDDPEEKAVERNKKIIEEGEVAESDASGASSHRAGERERNGERGSPMRRNKFHSGQRNVIARNNGGAAAAIAMITVGAIMLILGPAVILLRSLDERRQERRFLKLTSEEEEDLPPSYEQATASSVAGEEAPSYSSLNLNSISCPA